MLGQKDTKHRMSYDNKAATLANICREFAATGEAHTTAVDIWSLGVVAFTLLVSDHHDAVLNQMAEAEIQQYVTRVFSYLQKRPSVDAAKFVRSCLRLNPLRRISAQEAKGHEWLCGKTKNVELFKRLDKRVMSSWQPQNALRPMPWALPDLVPPPRHRKLDCYSLTDELTW
jgi:meiosis-specific serine/threonine-protein kinase MEK1